MSDSAFEYRADYIADADSRAAYNRLLKKEWPIPFEDWDRLGLWDGIRPFSFFCGGEAVANVSIAEIALIRDGRPCRAVQVGGVIVDPAYRGRGLARELTQRAFAACPDDTLFLLYAHNKVYRFYEQFGFARVAETLFAADIAAVPPAAGGARKLDLDDPADFELLRDLVQNRAPVSQRLGVRGGWPLYTFNVLFNDDICAIGDNVLYIEALDAAVVCARAPIAGQRRLRLVDVIGRRVPSLDELLPFIVGEQDREVEFRFTPDSLGCEQRALEIDGQPAMLDRQRLYARGPFPLDTADAPFFYPETYLF